MLTAEVVDEHASVAIATIASWPWTAQRAPKSLPTLARDEPEREKRWNVEKRVLKLEERSSGLRANDAVC